jgi:hypothetical protein
VLNLVFLYWTEGELILSLAGARNSLRRCRENDTPIPSRHCVSLSFWPMRSNQARRQRLHSHHICTEAAVGLYFTLERIDSNCIPASLAHYALFHVRRSCFGTSEKLTILGWRVIRVKLPLLPLLLLALLLVSRCSVCALNDSISI